MTTTGASFKVLVVDDSNTIRRSAEIFLKQGGHEVLLADDGFDALAKVNDYQPQLIFCDILMPKLDGYQTCAIIKRNARFADTPVVMLSSKDGVFDKARGRMVGCQEYLTKPFTKDQLLQAVQHRGQRQVSVVEQGRLQIGRWDGVRDVRQPVPRQRLWLEVKLCEILHGARTDPFIAAPLVVITMRRTHKSK